MSKQTKTPRKAPLSEAGQASSSIFALEQRIAFDGAFAETMETVASQSPGGDMHSGVAPASDPMPAEHDTSAISALSDMPALALVERSADMMTTEPRNEIVFIDASVEDAALLLAGIRPGVEVVLLDSTRDGVQQIADALEGRSDITAIHLISHGDSGFLRLGTSLVTAETINGEYADEFARIGAALSDNADFLIYGCDFGQGEAGLSAALALAQKTGADIAASNDLTGHASLGADWDLELNIGSLETSIIIPEFNQTAWVYTLEVATVDYATSAFTRSGVAATGNQDLTGVALQTVVNGVTVGITGARVGTTTTNTFQLQPAGNSNGVVGVITSLVDATIDDGTVYNEVTITFSQPVYSVSFSVIDIDGRAPFTTGGGGVFSDIITISSNAGLPTSVLTGPNVDYDPATGLVSTRGGNATTATDGTATYFFGNAVTSISIRHVAGDVAGTTNPANQGIGFGDISFNTAPGFTLPEDTSTQLTGLNTGSVAAGAVTTTLSAPSGTFTAANGGGVTVSGSGTGSLTLSGTRAAVDAYLASASAPTYVTTANANGAFTLTRTTNDGGPVLTDTRTIIVTPVNDAPSGTNYNSPILNEDVVHTLVVANFGLTDTIDSNQFAGVVITTLPASGVLRLNGVAVTAGQFISNLDVANNLLTFTPTANSTAAASFTFQVRDNGGTANGGVNTDTTPNTYTINYTAVNDAPVNALPSAYAVNTSTTTALTGITVTDVDAAAANISVTFSVPTASGTFTVNTGVAGGVTAGQVTGNNTRTVVLTGTLAAINATLANATGLRYVSTGTAGNITLTMTTSDLGNTGTGGTLTDIDTSTISVTAVTAANDAPTNTLPGPAGGVGWTATEDTSRILNGISITDIDIGAGNATVTFAITSGTLTIATGVAGGITAGQVTNNGTGSITITAPLSAINATLANAAGLTYTPALDNTVTATLTMTTSDNGGTGTGGIMTDIDTRTITFTAVNDVPVLTAPGSAAFTENGAAVAISPAITVADVDNASLTSASISITNFVFGEDVLAFTGTGATGNITAGYNSITGVLTLASAGSTATVAQWQAALRLVTYANTSENPTTTTRGINFQIADGPAAINNSNIVSATVSVTPVNDAPVLSGINDIIYTENNAASVINNAITVADIDNTTFASATVTIANFVAGQDVLAFTNVAGMGNISGVFNSGTGVLTLTSAGNTATNAEWQAALRAVTYANSSDNPTTTTRNIDFRVNDGQGANNLSNIITSTVAITAVNDNPVLSVAGAASYTENAVPVVIDTGITVADGDNTTFASATVTITNFVSGQDVLAFTGTGATGNIAGVFNSGTGILTLTSAGSTATTAQWQAALRLVTYANRSENPTTT
ncbi:MAG: DUF4347 domain-containing protein, partial [Beijerinckiaceae bacterium]